MSWTLLEYWRLRLWVPTGFNIWGRPWHQRMPIVGVRKILMQYDQPCALLAPLFSCSLLMSWGTGWPSTLLYTSLTSSASRFLSSLFRCMTNPPRFHTNTNGGNVIDESVLAKFNSITELLLNQGWSLFLGEEVRSPTPMTLFQLSSLALAWSSVVPWP